MTKNYDIIVVGAGNGGLVAACKAAKEGKKVLLVEKHNLPGGYATSFVRGRFEFEASLHELCGIGPLTGHGTAKQMFDDLGVSDRINWISLDECYRVMTTGDKENYDYTLPTGRENYIAKVEEYCPGGGKYAEKLFDVMQQIADSLDYLGNITDFTTDIIKKFFGEYINFITTAGYSVNEVFEAMNIPKPVRDIFSAYWCYLGTPLSEENFTHYFTMLQSYIVDGAVIPDNRSHGISCAMLDRFEELGGEVRLSTKVAKILVNGGKASGVELEDGTQISSKAVICNASPYSAYSKLIDKKDVPDFQFKNIQAKELGPKGFAVFLGLNRSPDELGIKNHTYFIYETGDTNKQALLTRTRKSNHMQATCCLNRGVPDCSPEGTTILYLTALFSGDTAWDDVTPENYVKLKREFASQMIDDFEKATGISIKEHIEEIEISSPVTYAHYNDAPNGTIYGFANTGSNTIVHRIMTDAFGSKIKNLYFCGGYTKQSLGFNPSYATGFEAGTLAAKECEKEAM